MSRQLGNAEWIETESNVVRNLVQTDIEDLVYAARRDLEWLEEYTGSLGQKEVDMSSMMQTPGRLRGAMSPRKMLRSTPGPTPSKIGFEWNKENEAVARPEIKDPKKPDFGSTVQAGTRSVLSPLQPWPINGAAPAQVAAANSRTTTVTRSPSVKSTDLGNLSPSRGPASWSQPVKREQAEVRSIEAALVDPESRPLERTGQTDQHLQQSHRAQRLPSPDPAPNSQREVATEGPVQGKLDAKLEPLPSNQGVQPLDQAHEVTRKESIFDDRNKKETKVENTTVRPARSIATNHLANTAESSVPMKGPSQEPEPHQEHTMEESPPKNKSWLGFSALPDRQPLSKKSMAKTPSVTSTGGSTIKGNGAKSVHWKKDPSSFQSKLHGSTASSGDDPSEPPRHSQVNKSISTNSIESHSDLYPQMTQAGSKSSATTPSSFDTRSSSGTNYYTPAPTSSIPSSPVRRLGTTEPKPTALAHPSPAKIHSKLNSSPEHKRIQPMANTSATVQAEGSVPGLAAGNAQISPSTTFMSMTAGVLRKAKQFLFDGEGIENASQQAQPEKLRETSPQKAPTTQGFSRLLAPTASSSRHALGTPSRSEHAGVMQSPLADKRTKITYPDLSKVMAHNSRLPKSTSNERLDRAQAVAPAPGTATSKPAQAANSQTGTSTTNPQASSAQSGQRLKESTSTSSLRNTPGPTSLAKQPLKAGAKAPLKPLSIKIPMGAQREMEEQRKNRTSAVSAVSAASTASVASTTSSTSSVASSAATSLAPSATKSIPLPTQTKTSHGTEEVKKPSIKLNLPIRNTVTGSGTGASKPSMLKRNPALESASKPSKPVQVTQAQPDHSQAAASGVKRPSTQLDSPLESKAHRVKLNAGPGPAAPKLGASSLLKTATAHQSRLNSQVPHVDGVKFSNDKLKFGPTSAGTKQAPSISSVMAGSLHRPAHSSAAAVAAAAAVATPQRASGDDIVLPDIMSESEDDDDGNVLEDWANSPELQSLLKRQQSIDPDSVFGPIAPLRMEEVFKSARTSRFRARSSSANWSNHDRLTQHEIDRYADQMGYTDK